MYCVFLKNSALWRCFFIAAYLWPQYEKHRLFITGYFSCGPVAFCSPCPVFGLYPFGPATWRKTGPESKCRHSLLGRYPSGYCRFYRLPVVEEEQCRVTPCFFPGEKYKPLHPVGFLFFLQVIPDENSVVKF